MRAKRVFHRIWVAMGEPLVKRGPGSLVSFQANLETSLLCIPITTVVFMLSFGYYDYMGWWEGRCGSSTWILKFHLSCSDQFIRSYLMLSCTFMTINVFWFWFWFWKDIWNYTGISNQFLILRWHRYLKPWTHLSCIINTMAADNLAKQGARTSAAKSIDIVYLENSGFRNRKLNILV